MIKRKQTMQSPLTNTIFFHSPEPCKDKQQITNLHSWELMPCHRYTYIKGKTVISIQVLLILHNFSHCSTDWNYLHQPLESSEPLTSLFFEDTLFDWEVSMSIGKRLACWDGCLDELVGWYPVWYMAENKVTKNSTCWLLLTLWGVFC